MDDIKEHGVSNQSGDKQQVEQRSDPEEPMQVEGAESDSFPQSQRHREVQGKRADHKEEGDTRVAPHRQRFRPPRKHKTGMWNQDRVVDHDVGRASPSTRRETRDAACYLGWALRPFVVSGSFAELHNWTRSLACAARGRRPRNAAAPTQRRRHQLGAGARSVRRSLGGWQRVQDARTSSAALVYFLHGGRHRPRSSVRRTSCRRSRRRCATRPRRCCM